VCFEAITAHLGFQVVVFERTVPLSDDFDREVSIVTNAPAEFVASLDVETPTERRRDRHPSRSLTLVSSGASPVAIPDSTGFRSIPVAPNVAGADLRTPRLPVCNRLLPPCSVPGIFPRSHTPSYGCLTVPRGYVKQSHTVAVCRFRRSTLVSFHARDHKAFITSGVSSDRTPTHGCSTEYTTSGSARPSVGRASGWSESCCGR